MSKSAKRWLLWGSIAALLLSFSGVVYIDSLRYNEKTDFLQAVCVAITIAAGLNLAFIPAFSYRNREGFRKWMRFLTLSNPGLIIILFILEATWFPLVPDIIFLTYLCVVLIVLAAGCLYIFVIDAGKAFAGIILILFYIILALVLRRFDASLYENHYYISFLLIGCGMYFYGLRSVFTVDKNRYLQVISYTACLLIYLGSLLMFYYSMTSRTPTFLVIYGILLFLLTLTVLLSLPVSGYIEWDIIHKSIFKRILIPWVFFLLLISIRFVFPDLNSLFFRQAQEEIQEFQLKDYPVINKNGLESE
ncbi:MAG: hypothetical protein V1903_01045 [Bacteroidota bacterium]